MRDSATLVKTTRGFSLRPGALQWSLRLGKLVGPACRAGPSCRAAQPTKPADPARRAGPTPSLQHRHKGASIMKILWTCRRFALAFSLACLALLAPVAQAGQEPAKAQRVVSIEGITEYRLENGVRFLLFPEPSASKVTVNMTVLVGSRHEGYGETGMAHLLEHMLFKGSKLYPNMDKALQDHGAAQSANGTTWVDRTNYYETMPAIDKNLEFGIRFEADRLVNCFIKREDLLS